ncbi:hypothetical protein ACIBI3_43890 [Actinomadura luteofluorescens]|uniref:hypothetical protein n=1 Tax=Actinomadura luteofluorescens TaxID=46163 RepID=UPI00347DD058
MRVLISGGGVAGLTCAYWLCQAGRTPIVLERAQAGPLGGYGIDLSGAGYDIADRMGILDQLAARQLRLSSVASVASVASVDAVDRVTARLDRPLAEKMLRGPYLALMHTTLEEVLANAVRGKAEVATGKASPRCSKATAPWR